MCGLNRYNTQYLISGGGKFIACADWNSVGSPIYPTKAQAFANARLIAAAPDLLEALIQMEVEKADYMRINQLGDPAREHTNKLARAAIAKATGQ